jgi:hypothetical protein
MPGVIIFDPDDDTVGFSVGEDQAAGVFLDIEEDGLYFTDTVNIHKWEGNIAAKHTYTWRSGKIRLPSMVNLGAVLVEAESYLSVIVKLYANGILITSLAISNNQPHRLPGGYISNIYEIEIISQDVVTGVSVATNIFELAEG